jgi:hypothetical protein
VPFAAAAPVALGAPVMPASPAQVATAPRVAPAAGGSPAAAVTASPALGGRDAILARGAAAGLLPFVPPPADRSGGAGPLTFSPVSGIAPRTTPAPAAVRPPVVRPAGSGSGGGGGGSKGPQPPSGPPGSAGAGGVASGFGGVAGGMWCAVLACFVLFASLERRRHRYRLVCTGPAGVAFPLRRPG